MTLLAGRYRIERELGRGAMGVVFLAYDERLDRPVALKELVLHSHLTPELRRELAGRFDHEARAAGRLNHPNIVSVYDVFSDDAHSFIVMEYIEGETLDALIGRGPVDPASAAAIAVQVLSAIQQAHANSVVHRDLKPENVFLQPNGTVKVTDFGIAHVGDTSASWTRAGTIVGTVGYMSPEQLRGEPVDQRTDLFAVGVLLFEMLTGMNPFGADTQTAVMYRIAHEDPPSVRGVRTGAPKYLDAVIRKALQKDREQRYQSAAEMASDILARRSPKVRPATIVPPFVPPSYAAVSGPRQSAPTVIGSAVGPDLRDAATQGVPGPSPQAGSDTIGGVDPSADAQTPVWRRTSVMAAVVAVLAVAGLVAVVMLLTPSRGSDSGTGAVVDPTAQLLDDARSVGEIQSRLAKAASTYAAAVVAAKNAETRNASAMKNWKESLAQYKKDLNARKAIVAHNAQENARASSPTYTTVSDPETGAPTRVKTSDGYSPNLKTVPSVPQKPTPPKSDLSRARIMLREARQKVLLLKSDLASAAVGSQAAPVLQQLIADTDQLAAATKEATQLISQATVRRQYDHQAYAALSPAVLRDLDDGAPLVALAGAARRQLLALLSTNGLSAKDLRGASGSPTPSPTATL